MVKSLINGKPSEQVSVHDRGFLYGDGVFETMPAFLGKVMWFDKHYDRLKLGCNALKIAVPKKEVLIADIEQLLGKQQRATIKIIITRGTSARGYKVDPDASPTRVVLCSEWNDSLRMKAETGIRLKLCKTPIGRHPILGSLKHLNRLENVLARQEWQGDEYDEGLMCDEFGNIVDGIMSNIFICKDKKIKTPRIQLSGINGIMRNWVLGLDKSWNIEEINGMTIDDVVEADEVFMSNSLIGLWPVKHFNDKHFEIGPIYKKLYKKLEIEYPVLHV